MTTHTNAQAYSLTLEQVQAAISGHNLHTYEGWTKAAQALLNDAPSWTAIKDGDYGYVVVIDGLVYSLAAEAGGEDAIYGLDLALDFDRSAWDDEIGGWCGGGQACADMLAHPVFVALRHD